MSINTKSKELEMTSIVYAITEDTELYVYTLISNEDGIIKKKFNKHKNLYVENVDKLYKYLSSAEDGTIVLDGYLITYDI